MTDCKHDWHFIEGTDRLRRGRCKVETGPRTPDQRVQDILQDDTDRYDPMLLKFIHLVLAKARQAELDACCDLLEGMHAASTGNHNYYLHAAVELRRLRAGK